MEYIRDDHWAILENLYFKAEGGVGFIGQSVVHYRLLVTLCSMFADKDYKAPKFEDFYPELGRWVEVSMARAQKTLDSMEPSEETLTAWLRHSVKRSNSEKSQSG